MQTFLTWPNTCINHHCPPTTSQSVSPLAHRRPVLGVFVFRLGCALKRSTPPPGERLHALPQPGHSTTETPLCLKRWRAMGTIPENVQFPDTVGCSSFFSRDRACVTWSLGTEGGRSCSSFGEATGSADISLAVSFSASEVCSVLSSGPSPSMIRKVSWRSTSSSAACSSHFSCTSVAFAS